MGTRTPPPRRTPSFRSFLVNTTALWRVPQKLVRTVFDDGSVQEDWVYV